LNDAQLDTPYRPEGWTARQVVHHLADSHINSVIRMKFALTEDEPRSNPMTKSPGPGWRMDARRPSKCRCGCSTRCTNAGSTCLRSLPASAFDRAFLHPENGRIPLNVAVAVYAWHGRHTRRHITSLREREGW
jgi:hypothetical protein